VLQPEMMAAMVNRAVALAAMHATTMPSPV
jgi:hypothetical protein